MSAKLAADIPVLLFNTGTEDKRACEMVMASGIPCEFVGSTSEHDPPVLLWSHRKLEGAGEIAQFLSSRKAGK